MQVNFAVVIATFFFFHCIVCTESSSRNSSASFSMVLVGGGLLDDNSEIWNKIIELGGGVGTARFGVISAASENPCCDEDSSWVYYRDLLTFYGAAEVYYVPVTVDSKLNNSNPEVVTHVKTLTGFFFGGGDQLRIMESFYNGDAHIPSDVLRGIKESVLSNGGVVAGTSAGTDCQTAKTMITGGLSYNGLRDGAATHWHTQQPESDAVTGYGSGGIGLFTHGLVDTHFSNRGRHGRLLELLLDSGSEPLGHPIAFGIDENTALVVTGRWTNRVGEVIGQRGVLVLDTSDALVTPRQSGEFSNVRVSRMSQGDHIDLQTLAITPASFKKPMASGESDAEAETSRDIFHSGSFQFDKISLSLFSSTAKSTFGMTPLSDGEVQYKLSIGKVSDVGAAAVGFDGTDPATGLYAHTLIGMWVDVHAVTV